VVGTQHGAPSSSWLQAAADNPRGPGAHGDNGMLLMRGPRIKCGVECCGEVKASVSPSTARMEYRGRVMNRAARMSNKAHSGTVVCSAAAWALACADVEAAGVNNLLRSQPLGSWPFKGVGRIEVVGVTWVKSVLALSAATSQDHSSSRLTFMQQAGGITCSRGVQAQPIMRDGCSQTD
jgi:hypothetical protein